MLNSYTDGCLMNESHVFYTATNTFRNPAFEPPQIEPRDDHDHGQRGQPQNDGPVRQAAERQHSASPVRSGPVWRSCVAGQPGATTTASASSLQKSCSNDMSFSSNQSELGQRWQEFCDNLSLSIRGRLFVMESNFKRRLRAVRKYLDKKLPWCVPLTTQGGRNPRERRRSRQTGAETGGAKLGPSLGQFQFPEPKSADTLDAQQECLLNRLERIKRERLFRLPEESSQTSRQEEEDDDDDDEAHERATLGCSDKFAPASSMQSPDSSDEDSSRPATSPGAGPSWFSMAGDRAQPLALFSSISNSPPMETKSKKSCIVCYARPPNIVTLPCKHSDICSDCFIEIIYMAVKHSQYPLRCVLCRQRVERIRCSRRLLLSVIEKNRLR